MNATHSIYKCPICGNIVEMLHIGGGELVCCGQPMEKLVANTTDGAVEKHVPVVEKTSNGFIVRVGEAPHPMEKGHYIEWISVYFDDGKTGHKHLNPGDAPEVEFFMNKMPIKVLAYCNLHGLWSKED